MKKFLLITSVVIVFILALGAASAADGDNITGDSPMSVASDSVGDVEADTADDEYQSSMNDLNNQKDILADSGKETPNVNVADGTAFVGENVTVHFNVTDSKGSLISGDVNATLSGENKTISKIVKINNGSDQFKMADLIEILKADGKLDITDIYNIVSSGMNSTDGNVTETILGLGEVHNGFDINISGLISGMSELMNTSNVDVSRLMGGLAIIAKGINITMLTDGLDDILNASNINISTFPKVLKAVIDGFDFNLTEAINKIAKGTSINRQMMVNGISDLIKALDLPQGKSVTDIIKDLGLKLSPALALKAVIVFAKNPIQISDITNLFNEILAYNKITPAEFMERVFNQAESNFNLTDFIYKIINSDTSRDNIGNALSKIVKSINMDPAVLNSVISNLFDSFNSSKVISEVEDITGINMSDASTTSGIIDGVYKAMMALGLNASSIAEGTDMIISSFKFYIPSVMEALNKISSSVSYNNSMVMDGLDKIADGIGINVSSIASQIIAKYGYFVTFTDYLAPGVYNISAEYLPNGKYDSAVNDTAKFIVINRKDTSITADATVDGTNVAIAGKVASNASGIVILEIGDYGIAVPVIAGNFTYENTFAPGDYNITALYLGNWEFNKSNATIAFTVKSPTKFIASDVSTVYGTGKNLAITLTDVGGNAVIDKEVTVKFNGNTKSDTTNSKGQISVAVPSNLIPKTYTASVSFAGDDKYIKTTGTAKVVVSKAKAKITAKNKAFKVKTKTKKYTIVLKNNKGKAIKNGKVTIKVKGKTYSAKTNSKGKATFKITKLTKKGKFKATIKFAGSKYYKAVTKSVQITVK